MKCPNCDKETNMAKLDYQFCTRCVKWFNKYDKQKKNIDMSDLFKMFGSHGLN